MHKPPVRRIEENGFTYLGVLAAVAVLGAVMGATVEVWHTSVVREKERQLLFVGQQYRQAIELYYRNTPGQKKSFPPTLEALLEDARLPGTQRYLRRLYRDPITNTADWGLARAEDAGIVGVYSLSTARPLKTAGFGPDDTGFEGADQYAAWVFAARPGHLGVQGRLTRNP